MQVVSTGLAIVLLWGFVIWGLVKPRYMFAQVNEWKSWISYNFTWFYIGAFVSQPSPVSNTILLPAVTRTRNSRRGNEPLASAMRRVDASVRALIGTPRRLVSFAPHARVFSSLGSSTDTSAPIRFKRSPQTLFFNPCFPAVFTPKKPLSTRRLTAPPLRVRVFSAERVDYLPLVRRLLQVRQD